MPSVTQPDVLSPLRTRSRAARWLGDEQLDLLAHLLDEWFRIPGTSIRIGLDGLIGFIPGIGDLLTGLTSLILIAAAWLRGVPYATLARMTVNVGMEVLIGSVPIVGDLFIVAWKANRRNYRLMTRQLAEPRRHTWKDQCFLVLMGLCLAGIFLAPLVILYFLLRWLL
uniref:DUF4112 domain-containing protein n=1 Tax=Acidobacterium capsulatum TaxID=33075 RepID=A0A7V5CTE5_9BACT